MFHSVFVFFFFSCGRRCKFRADERGITSKKLINFLINIALQSPFQLYFPVLMFNETEETINERDSPGNNYFNHIQLEPFQHVGQVNCQRIQLYSPHYMRLFCRIYMLFVILFFFQILKRVKLENFKVGFKMLPLSLKITFYPATSFQGIYLHLIFPGANRIGQLNNTKCFYIHVFVFV